MSHCSDLNPRRSRSICSVSCGANNSARTPHGSSLVRMTLARSRAVEKVSKCWYLPLFADLTSLPHVHVVTSDFCRHGAKLRKPSTFICGNIPIDDLHRLQCQCSGHKLWSRSGRGHFQLNGKGSAARTGHLLRSSTLHACVMLLRMPSLPSGTTITLCIESRFLFLIFSLAFLVNIPIAMLSA